MGAGCVGEGEVNGVGRESREGRLMELGVKAGTHICVCICMTLHPLTCICGHTLYPAHPTLLSRLTPLSSHSPTHPAPTPPLSYPTHLHLSPPPHTHIYGLWGGVGDRGVVLRCPKTAQ